MNEASMFSLIQFYGPTLAVCVGLGAATAWWMFRDDGRRRSKGETKP
jgi:hypothetical protein